MSGTQGRGSGWPVGVQLVKGGSGKGGESPSPRHDFRGRLQSRPKTTFAFIRKFKREVVGVGINANSPNWPRIRICCLTAAPELELASPRREPNRCRRCPRIRRPGVAAPWQTISEWENASSGARLGGGGYFGGWVCLTKSDHCDLTSICWFSVKAQRPLPSPDQDQRVSLGGGRPACQLRRRGCDSIRLSCRARPKMLLGGAESCSEFIVGSAKISCARMIYFHDWFQHLFSSAEVIMSSRAKVSHWQ